MDSNPNDVLIYVILSHAIGWSFSRTCYRFVSINWVKVMIFHSLHFQYFVLKNATVEIIKDKNKKWNSNFKTCIIRVRK